MDLKSTLNLPDPNFTIPMKADLASREPGILAKWEDASIYHQRMVEHSDRPVFVLHDGPPYTNGPIHAGTAFNNILKDFVLKSRYMMGFQTPFVPGYDNHGLPIEQAVMKKFHAKKHEPTLAELLAACREHATEFIALQTQQRKRLGMFGLWENPYRTMDFRYEANVVRMFKRLVERGRIYRGLKPTLWSPTSQTALADTEIVYFEHTSKSIFVRFPLIDDHNGWAKGLEGPVFCIIWTTTPWTIPANLGVAFHPGLEYVVVQVDGVNYVLQKDLLEKVSEKLGWNSPEVVQILLGASFEFSKFQHPIFERASLAVLADYVTTEDGTGVVHTAPGHGREDFITGQKYGLQVLCPVNERGVLTSEAGEFEGQYYKACDVSVVDRLREVGNLLHVEDFVHQYPHAERDEQPVIFRATEQWFVDVDSGELRQTMLGEIEKVDWHPESAQGRITTMIAGRPDWCISRQRPWGVGIPVFYGAPSGEPVLDPALIEHVATIIEEKGSSAWFNLDAMELIPSGYKHPMTGETEFTKETDVFDVWFDSGSTWSSVLEGDVYPEWKAPFPADLYLEGSDQHRGWFNVSLILATAVRDQAPYKAVVTHGFVNDEEGRKMSKRLGNVIDPVKVADTYGADVLRLWAASVNYEDDVSIGEALLKTAGESYRKIRNTLRFLLGNLEGFSPAETPEELLPTDEWILEQTEILCADVVRFYELYQFRAGASAIHNFCVNELSAFYLDAIKDRMYCDGRDWKSRKSAQAACYQVAWKLLLLVAPILPYTAEEIHERFPNPDKKKSVHLETFEVPSDERLDAISGSRLQSSYADLMQIRAATFVEFEKWKADSGTKSSQEVVAFLSLPQTDFDLLEAVENYELANLFKMSWVHLSVGEFGVRFEPSSYPECQRSRLRRPDVEEVQGMWLSKRDRQAIGLEA